MPTYLIFIYMAMAIKNRSLINGTIFKAGF